MDRENEHATPKRVDSVDLLRRLGHVREAPEGFGFWLAGTYLITLIAMALLYFSCKWFADLKRRRKDLVVELFMILDLKSQIVASRGTFKAGITYDK